jgi:uncharacterized protein
MRTLRLLLALIGMVVLTMPAAAQTFPPLSGRVVDAAKLLSPEQVTQLTQLSEQVEQASTRQFVVATIPDLQGYPIEDYGYRLGRAWKIGQKDARNGIILIVAPNERKVRIEVGYGLEPIMTDALSSVIINDTILPRFKAGDMPGGIMDGAAAIAEQMKQPLEVAEQRAQQAAGQSHARHSKRGGNPLAVVFWVIVIVVIILPMAFGRARGRRYRGGLGEAVLWGSALSNLGSGSSSGSSWGGGGGSDWGGGGGGGFSGGGGSFGGGGASGSW